jgi:hypothetical protein
MQPVPADDSESLAKLLETVQTLYIDGTERSIQRSLHKEEQKRHYSGKKTQSVKHNLISDENKVILYLSKAYNETTHDKK